MRTKTFAEICVRQGQLDEAASIYKDLIKKKPNDAALRQRLAEIEVLMVGAAGTELAPPPEPEPTPAPAPAPEAPRRPLPTDLPPKAGATPRPPKQSPRVAKALQRARQIERLEKILYRIQNRRRKVP